MPVEELHHDEVATVVSAGVIDMDEARVRDAGGGSTPAQETRGARRLLARRLRARRLLARLVRARRRSALLVAAHDRALTGQAACRARRWRRVRRGSRRGAEAR